MHSTSTLERQTGDHHSAQPFESGPPSPQEEFGSSASVRRLQRVSWFILVLAGLVQTWYERHRIFSDGLSYLDIASYYAKGDWHAALNSYWSPLYSWLLAALMVVFHPDPYWDVALLHVVNYGAYLLAIVGLELLLSDVLRLQRRMLGAASLSEFTVRTLTYSVFILAGLLLIDTGYNSPDMVAMAIGFYLLHVFCQIEAGRANLRTYLFFGAALGLEYLCRAAFAAFVLLYLVIAGTLLLSKRKSLRPLAYTVLVTLLVSLPFVTALSVSKGRFTIGDAGKLNYGWELDGAARSTNWQGEPYDIGKPIHPTHKVLSSPPTYTFASPVPGTYPPWYEPSYWYEGIKPKLKLEAQLKVFVMGLAGVAYLMLRSPITIPVLVLSLFGGWRQWFSRRGLPAYWFLLVPTSLYILSYTLVFIDSRYIASSLVVIWLCLLVSVPIPDAAVRSRINKMMQILALLTFGFVMLRLARPAKSAAADLVHHQEAEWNLNWMVADRLKSMGVQPTDRVAWIGQAIDAEWASILGVKIVAEVPVTWERDNTLFRRVYAGRKPLKEFWWSSPAQKAQVFQAFRDAGATIVVLDSMPNGVDQSGWQRVLAPETPHVTDGVAQYSIYKKLYFERLSPPPVASGVASKTQ